MNSVLSSLTNRFHFSSIAVAWGKIALKLSSSSSLKSTLSAYYSVSSGRPAIVIGVISPSKLIVIVDLSSFKAPAETRVNSQPDKQSPWKAPRRLKNSAERTQLTFTRSFVLDNNNQTILSSSLEQPHNFSRLFTFV